MLLLLRLLVGTGLYTIIVLLATPFPRAAAMMLVFPSLNGLSYLFAPPASLAPMGRSMLLMPTINGTLLTGYIVGFLALSRHIPADLLAWLLFAGVAVLWVIVTSWDAVRRGVEHQFVYSVAVTLAGLLLVVIFAQLVGTSPLPRTDPGFWRIAIKIGLFIVCLFAFLVCTTYFNISDAYRGILSGLPLVPFAGLLSVAGDPSVDVEVRLATLRSMGLAIGLGPPVATWFIYAIPRRWKNDPHPGGLRRFRDLIIGWALCGLTIAAMTVALERFI
jgi:hypothetical protein